MINPYSKSNTVTKNHVVNTVTKYFNEIMYIKCLVKLSATEETKNTY